MPRANLVLVALLLAASSVLAVERIVVTLKEYNACDVDLKNTSSSIECVSVAKCYGRRLVLNVGACEMGGDVADWEMWVRQELGLGENVAMVEEDSAFSVSQMNVSTQEMGQTITMDIMSNTSADVFMDSENNTVIGSPDQWNLRMIGIYELWANFSSKGENYTVAVLDSGVAVSALDAFGTRIVPGYDFVSDEALSKDGDGRDADFYDPGDADAQACPGSSNSWHGTKVASVLAANYENFLGVAPEAHVMPVRVLGRCGVGYASDVADGIVWAAGGQIKGLEWAQVNELEEDQDRKRVIVMALAGKGRCPSFMQTAVDLAVSKDIQLFAAAGNDPSLNAADHFPANCKGVVSVGALNAQGQIASYSSKGADVYMPGGDFDRGVPCLGADLSSVESCMGTSFAVPHAAGAGVVTGLDFGVDGQERVQTGGGDNNGTSIYVHAQAVSATAIQVSAGSYHTCALIQGGTVKCWGANNYYNLGDGTNNDNANAVDTLPLGAAATQVSVGYYSTCALLTGGTVKCWGNNAYGQLGDGATTSRSSPASTLALGAAATQISVGQYHTCALLTDGTVKCWGHNLYGQLGDGTTTTRSSPALTLALGAAATQIAASQFHTCALLTGGTVACWGYNGEGHIGDGTTTNRPSPTSTLPLGAAATQISVGQHHTCALLTGGTVKCWGNNAYGQIGDGTTTGRLSPTSTLALGAAATRIAVNQWHNCALLTDGTVKCWGHNGNGQIGDGTYVSPRPSPTSTMALGAAATQVSAGWYHTCALLTGGTVTCWGYNSNGQLGDGTVGVNPNCNCKLSPVVALQAPPVCLAGEYVTGLVCTICPAGSFSGIGSSSCSPCPSGTYSATPGATSNSSCQQCPAGFFSSQNSTRCTACLAGTFSTTPGGTSIASCTLCPAGQFASNAGSSNCSTCPAGYFSSSGSTQCTICPAGSFSGVNSSTCSACPAGTFSTTPGATSNSSCTACPAGFFSSQNSTSCSPCPAGTYTNLPAPSCVPQTFTSSALCLADAYSCQYFSSNTIRYCSMSGSGGTMMNVYPPQPLTGWTTTLDNSAGYGAGTYVVTMSADPQMAGSEGFKAFALSTTGARWSQSVFPAYNVPYVPWTTQLAANTNNGLWISLQLPSPKLIHRVTLGTTYDPAAMSTTIYTRPIAFSLYGRLRSAGTWSVIAEEWRDMSFVQWGSSMDWYWDSGCTAATVAYDEVALVVVTYAGGDFMQISQFRVYSYPDSVTTKCPLQPGASSCTACAAGTFSSAANATSNFACQACPAGSFSSAAGRTNCTACAAGTFSATIGATSNASCLTCPAGSFSLSNSTSCTACPAGTFSAAAGSSACQQCSAGLTSAQGSPNCSCPAGQYFGGIVSSYPSESSTSWLSSCSQVVNGYAYRVKASSVFGAGNEPYMLWRGSGTYWMTSNDYDGWGTALRTQIYFSTYTTFFGEYVVFDMGASFVLKEYIFDGNQVSLSRAPATWRLYGINDDSVWTANTCCAGPLSACNAVDITKPWQVLHEVNANYVWTSPSTWTVPANNLQTRYIAFQVKQSKYPYYIAYPGANDRILLDELVFRGFYPSCTLCAAGSFLSTPGATSCTLCQAGTYSNTTGATNASVCQVCSAGSFSGPGSLSCQQCPAGTFSNTTAATSNATCQKCSPGYFASQPGSTVCQACPQGTFSNATGAINSATCQACAAGFFSNATAATSNSTCQSCPAGLFSSSAGSANCSACPAGKYSNTASATSSLFCTPCPAGTYSNATGLASSLLCLPCNVGTFSNATGATSDQTCALCPAGTFSNTTGLSRCFACGAGRFASTAGATSCALCPKGSSTKKI